MMETGTEAMLTERIRDMSSDEAVKLVSELCAQLENSGQAVHGNIWPGNVTVNEDGTAVLGEGSDATVSERKAVQVEFLAPEYFWDNSAGGAGDVYSLGLLLYAGCNGGYLPFQPKGGALTDRDRSGALRKRMKGEPVTLPAGTDPRLGAVILKALSYEPEERYQSPGELLAALNASEEELPGEDLAEAAVAAGAVSAAAFDTEETVDLSHLDPETAPAADLPEEPNSPEETPTWTGKPAPVETAREVPSAEPEKKYTVQKDFDGGRKSGKNSGRKTSRGTTAVPATRKKKKASPAIPILCVAALAVIGGAAWVGFNHGGELLDRIGLTRQPAPTPEISEPYVILNTESTPEPTEAPMPSPLEEEDTLQLIQPDLKVEEEATPTPEPTPTPVVGSSSIDGVDVTPTRDVVSVITSGTNLRSGPGTGYEIQKTLARGTQMDRTGTVNGWSQVQFEGEEYYVSSNLVEVDETATAAKTESLDNSGAPADSTPAPEGITPVNGGAAPAATTPAPAAGNTNSSTNTGTAPAANPGTGTAPATTNTNTTPGNTGTAPVVTNPGTPTITGTAGGTNSAPAATTSTSANVTATRDVISVTGSDVHLRSGPGTGYSILATLAPGTTLQRTGTVNGWSRVVYQGGEAYVIDTYISPVSSSTVSAGAGTLKVTSDVNVRSGASTDNSILGIAKTGETLSVTGVTDGGKWYRVTYNGQEGYVNRKLVSIQDFALVTDKSGTASVTTRANVRSGPGTGYTILGQAEVGTNLTISGYADNNWYKVSFNGQTGYIAGNLVKVS